MASYPGVTVHLDCTKGLKTSARGNTHLLAIVDNFSGYLKLYSIPQPTAKDVAGALLQYICINSKLLKIGQSANESTLSSPPSSLEISEEPRFSSYGRMQQRNQQLLDKDIYAFLIY